MVTKPKHNYRVAVIDFGSQSTALIMRRLGEFYLHSKIFSYSVSLDELNAYKPIAIVLTGGPSSIYEKNSLKLSFDIKDLKIPVLGICYGMQLIAHALGGEVSSAKIGEYGRAILANKSPNHPLFKDIPDGSVVWMNHQDFVSVLPKGAELLCSTNTIDYAGFVKDNLYCFQFHPEVIESQFGNQMISNFLFNIVGIPRVDSVTLKSFFTPELQNEIKTKVGNKQVVCALSGGIDSAVTFLLLRKIIGEQVHPIFVNTGLLRECEEEKVVKLFRDKFNIHIQVVDAKKRFLDSLKGVTDSEEKRKRVGHEFIAVFEEEAKKIKNVEFLAQGTIAPDVIESADSSDVSHRIKSHHNVSGLPEKMGLKLIEPVRSLFKDQVREVAKELGFPSELVHKHPFPGPGLSVRVIGEVTEEKLNILRRAEVIVSEEFNRVATTEKITQGFAVLLPMGTTGIKGDCRNYGHVIAIRSVYSEDNMTADWVRLPNELLERISNRIPNEVKEVCRVVYDITSKPPATIEWE